MFLHLLFQVIFVDPEMDLKLCLLLRHQCNLENADISMHHITCHQFSRV